MNLELRNSGKEVERKGHHGSDFSKGEPSLHPVDRDHPPVKSIQILRALHGENSKPSLKPFITEITENTEEYGEF